MYIFFLIIHENLNELTFGGVPCREDDILSGRNYKKSENFEISI